MRLPRGREHPSHPTTLPHELDGWDQLELLACLLYFLLLSVSLSPASPFIPHLLLETGGIWEAAPVAQELCGSHWHNCTEEEEAEKERSPKWDGGEHCAQMAERVGTIAHHSKQAP